jgi:hypothetical protein
MYGYSNHKNKYVRYKKKYPTFMFSGGFVPDEEISNEDEMNFVESIMENIEEETNEKIENEITKVTNYIGDSNITTDKIGTIVPIGKIDGKICDYANFDKDDFTNVLIPNKNKILEIVDIDAFDNFTDKFGYLSKKKKLRIDWKKVSKQYRGIYISSSINNRVNEAVFFNKAMDSFIIDQYKYIDDVIIFIEEEEIKHDTKITYPFKGYIMDYYAIDEQLFVNINDKITHDKILVINSIKHFDQFTNKYGDNGSKILWDKVSIDFIGLYIGDDIELKNNRYAKCFFNEKMVDSWWKVGKLYRKMVYKFA